MVVNTRSSSEVNADVSHKILLSLENLSQRLGTVEKFGERLDKIQDTIDAHSGSIAKLQASQNLNSSMVERVFRKVNDEIKETNVAEACGVDYTSINRNQLFGEQSMLKKKKGMNKLEKAEKKRRELIGGYLFLAYCITFFTLMVLSFNDMLPIYEWEKKGAEFYRGTNNDLGDTISFPFIISLCYIITIFGIKYVLQDRKPFNLRMELAFWSLIIGCFSIFGSLRTVPVFFKMVSNKGVENSLCGDTRTEWMINNPAGYWTYLFILSKMPELIDTLFIVFRKRKLITLHWYHHVTVLCFCWHSWGTCSNGLVFAAMNLTVHAFMYIFYSLTALGYRPTAFAQSITIIQILQMVCGTAVTLYFNIHMLFIQPIESYELFDMTCPVGLEIDNSPSCKINPTNALAGLAMYASYLYLFCMFFYFAYIKPKNSASISLKTKKEK